MSKPKFEPNPKKYFMPEPKGYLLKCCGCGAVHRFDFRVNGWGEVEIGRWTVIFKAKRAFSGAEDQARRQGHQGREEELA